MDFATSIADSQFALIYRLFYQGRLPELLDLINRTFKTDISTQTWGRARFDPVIATMEAMLRLSSFDIVEDLSREMVKIGVSLNEFDILGRANKRILDLSDSRYVGINEDLFFTRVLHWVNEVQSFRAAREMVMEGGARAVHPDV